MAPLPPPHPTPLYINSDYIAEQAEAIIVREHCLSWSGDDFTISLADGRPLIRVDGKAFSFQGRKLFKRMDGSPLYTLRRKQMAWMPTFYAKLDDGGPHLFDVKFHFKMFGSKAEITFINAATKQQEMFVLTGDWRNKGASIVHERTGLPVATIERRRFNAREIFGNAQTYNVVCAQNVDLSLIVGIVVTLDESREGNSGSGAGAAGGV